MKDAFLTQLIATSNEFPGLSPRLFVVAWGRMFDGTLGVGAEFKEAMLKRIELSLQPPPQAYQRTIILLDKAEAKLATAFSEQFEETEAESLYLKSVRTENGGELEWLRIPLAEVEGYSLQQSERPSAVTTGFGART